MNRRIHFFILCIFILFTLTTLQAVASRADMVEREMDWNLVARIVSAIVFIGGVIVFVVVRWNRALAKEIIERKRVEQALKEREQLFKRTFYQAPVGAAIIDLKERFIDINEKLVETLGYSNNELLTMSFADLVHRDDRKIIESHFSSMLGGKTDHAGYTCRCLHKNGNIVWGNISVRPIYDEGTKNPVHFIPIIEDITEKKIADDNLRKLSKVVEDCPFSIVITDVSGIIEYVNPKFLEISGYDLFEVIGEHINIVESGEHPDTFYDDMWDTILSGKEWRGQFINKSKQGELHWESASISPIKNKDNAITHFVSVQEDVTEKKKADTSLKKRVKELADMRVAMLNILEDLEEEKNKAEDATRAKSDFLANMSHEIRTPMNAIFGMNHLLLKSGLNPKQKKYASNIHASAQNLLGIINDILDFSKIEAGKLDVEIIEFDLNVVMNTLSNMVGLKVEEYGLELVFSIDPAIPAKLVGDSLRLSQILLNLVNNAITFTDTGEIVVSIDMADRSDKEVTLSFKVQDTGIGISKDQQQTLFNSFQQADSSTTRRYGGSGLGLAICKTLTELMGGEIGVQSALGEGSIFFFTLTFGLQQKKETKEVPVPGLFDGMKVLIVDDNRIALKVFELYLDQYNFDLHTANTGSDALAKIEEAVNTEAPEYELILMDWMMPGMDGLETAKRILEHPGIVNPPKIVMVTAYGREDVVRSAEQTGLHGILIKPVTKTLLIETIMDVFGLLNDTGNDIEALALSETAGFESLRGARILVVEDNDINVELVEELLQQEGLNVSIVENGKEAVNLLWSTPEPDMFDAVLMDLQMPVMDGYTTTQLIRKNKRFKDLPVIAMTADAMSTVHEKAVRAGMNDYIAKPIDPNCLFRTLAKWVKPVMGPPHVPMDNTMQTIDIPELPGIDTMAGLKHVRENMAVYKKILLSFASDQADTPYKIQVSIRENDSEKAIRLTHTLKGLSGSIGASQVSDAAKTLENALKTGEPCKGYLISLSAELRRVVEGIRCRLPKQKQKFLTPAPDATEEDFQNSLKELAVLLSEDNTASVKSLKFVLHHPIARQFNKEMGELSRYVDNYDFDNALKSLSDIADKVSITLPVSGSLS